MDLSDDQVVPSHNKTYDIEMSIVTTANPMNMPIHDALTNSADIGTTETIETSIDRSVSTASINSRGKISYDEFLKQWGRFKAELDHVCKDWVDDEDEKTFLKSSHMILYKWHDYMSVPLKHPFAKILCGKRLVDKDGNDNQHRFMLVFHDLSSLFVMGLSYILLFGEISMLIAIVSQLVHQNCHHDEPKGTVTLVPLILCALYASSVASDRFFQFTPFELTGQSMESYCAIANILVANGHKYIPRHVNFYHMFGADLQRIAAENPSRREAVNKVLLESTLRDSSTFILTIALQFANVLLLTTVAIVMGTSRHVLDLVQNFISVEIVVHIHEFIPKALRLVDQSPQSFNSSFTAVSWID